MTWTAAAADAAELDVLVWELTSRFFEHRETCEACRTPFVACPRLQRAIAVVLDWREARELRSRAEELRIERMLLEAIA